MKRQATSFDLRTPLIANSTLSSTVSRGNSPTPCNVREIPSPASPCGRTRSSGLPFHSIVPAAGATNPQIALNSVVLPAPFGPITPSTWPRSTPSETFSSAMIPPNLTVRSQTARSARSGSSLDSTHEQAIPAALRCQAGIWNASA